MPEGFPSLRIWQSGYQLLMKIYELTSKYPAEEKFVLASQTRKAANSIIANIAESHGRYFYKDKIRVLYIARGEIAETQSHLRVALGLNYLDKEMFNEVLCGYEALLISINQQVRQLVSQLQNKKRD